MNRQFKQISLKFFLPINSLIFRQVKSHPINSLPNSWQTSKTIKEPAQGSIIKSPFSVVASIRALIRFKGFWCGWFLWLAGKVASTHTLPKLLFLKVLLLVGCFWTKKANSAWLLSHEPKPKVLALYQTSRSTIFNCEAWVNHLSILPALKTALLTHKRQKAEGFNILAIAWQNWLIWLSGWKLKG